MHKHEWRAYGDGFPRAGIRLAMLDEGVQIMRQAWREGQAALGAEKTGQALRASTSDVALGTGTPEQVAERLTAMRSAGLGYGIFYFPEAAHDTSSIELFEQEVAPALLT